MPATAQQQAQVHESISPCAARRGRRSPAITQRPGQSGHARPRRGRPRLFSKWVCRQVLCSPSAGETSTFPRRAFRSGRMDTNRGRREPQAALVVRRRYPRVVPTDLLSPEMAGTILRGPLSQLDRELSPLVPSTKCCAAGASVHRVSPSGFRWPVPSARLAQPRRLLAANREDASAVIFAASARLPMDDDRAAWQLLVARRVTERDVLLEAGADGHDDSLKRPTAWRCPFFPCPLVVSKSG